MKTAINRFVDTLKSALGSQLQSVIWYGPACRNPSNVQPEEVQLLIIVKALGVEELEALADPVNRWLRKRHPFPKIFTRERLLKSTDVFPIECLSVQSDYELIYGEDIASELTLSDANLRLQLESEFKGKLLQLREAFLLSRGKPKVLVHTMTISLTAFESLFAALARTLGQSIPADLSAAATLLSTQLEVADSAVLLEIQELRAAAHRADKAHVHALFARYLSLVEQVADRIDAL